MRKFHSKCHTLIYISNLDILTRMVYNIKCNKKTPDLCVRVHTHTSYRTDIASIWTTFTSAFYMLNFAPFFGRFYSSILRYILSRAVQNVQPSGRLFLLPVWVGVLPTIELLRARTTFLLLGLRHEERHRFHSRSTFERVSRCEAGKQSSHTSRRLRQENKGAFALTSSA